MINQKPSLLERAAQVYDFASGLPVAAPADLPPPQPRPRVVRKVPASMQPEHRPTRAAVSPLQAAPQPQPQPRKPAPSSAHHDQVELDQEALAAAGFLVPDAPGGSLAEEMRLIKRRLLSAVDARAGQGDDQARVVLIASGQPGEGKTFVALNLALSIASEPERRVLLIDGDNAKPEVLKRLGVAEDRPGFVDALTDARLDPEALVVDTNIDRLSLLAAGRRERNLPELLASVRTPELLERLLAADPSRIILIDSSPALAASAAGVLAGHAGQTLVVVKADTTGEADLKETLDLLSACDHLSLVLNSTAFKVGTRRFGKYEEYR